MFTISSKFISLFCSIFIILFIIYKLYAIKNSQNKKVVLITEPIVQQNNLEYFDNNLDIIETIFTSDSVPENNTLFTLLDTENTNLLLSSKDDNFIDRLDKINLKARGVKSIEEYTFLISDCATNLNDKQKAYLYDAINFINNYNLEEIECINAEKFKSIEWKIAVIKNDGKYEKSLPHTRYNVDNGYVVIIPENLIGKTSSMINTLMHEQMHIYQKMYKTNFEQFLEENGWEKMTDISDFTKLRTNPDTDGTLWIYENISHEPFLCSYNSDNPDDIMDVIYEPINSAMYEHPNEYYAYKNSNLI